MERSIHEQFLEKPENRRLYQQEKALIDATELLTEVMERKQMSRADLARAIGKSKAFVTQVLRGNQNMTLRTLADLFGAMRYEIIIQALPYPEDQTQIPDLDASSPFCYNRFWSQHFARQAQAELATQIYQSHGKGRRHPVFPHKSVPNSPRLAA